MLTREEIEAFKAKKLEKRYKDIFSSKDMLDKVTQLDKKLEKLRSGLKLFDHDLEEEKQKIQRI
ncbi:hypothetical protein KY343_03255 [Candidatus Woesearchaeota archaeon]|nr:hypothetical protein [Candidatus Woesearchaeota archaeon]